MSTLTMAQKFALLLISEYLIAAGLFGKDDNWLKCVYFIGCAIKDLSVILL